jgi:hypothetical protein
VRATVAQVHEVVQWLGSSTPVPLLAFVPGDDPIALSHELRDDRVAIPVRIKDDRVFYGNPLPPP